MQKVLLALIALFTIACGEQKDSTGETATVTFKLDKASLEKINLSTTSNPRKVDREFKQWLSKQNPDNLDKNQERIIFGQTAPAPASGFSCYAVVAQYQEEADSSTCRKGDLTKVFGGDEIYGFASLGGEISGETLRGSNRTFYLIGLFSSSGGCPSALNTFPNAVNDNYSPPVLLGQTTVDIQSGANVVNLSANVTATELSGCEGDILGGDTSLDACKPELNSNANNQTSGVGQFAQGDGSSGNPFIICNPTQLHNFTLSVTGGSEEFQYELGTNINMSGAGDFTAAGCGAAAGASCAPAAAFTGVFDGNGYIIANLNFFNRTAALTGLVARLKGPGQITSLTLNNINMTVASDKAGGIAASAYGNGSGSKAVINKVKVQGTMNVTGNNHSSLGGIVGYLHKWASVLKAKNSVDITTTGSSVIKVGGIAGNVKMTNSANQVIKIHEVGNKGKIDNDGNGGAYNGGIVGSAYPFTSNSLQVYDAYNTGSVISKHTAAGIVSKKNGANGEIKIKRAFNTGKVTTQNGGVTGTLGGIIGGFQAGTEISRAFNTGILQRPSNSNDHGGAIAGYFPGAPTFTGAANLYAFNNSLSNVVTTAASKCSGNTGKDINVGAGVCTVSTDINDFRGNSNAPIFTSWDFTNTWEVQTGDFPKLKNLPE